MLINFLNKIITDDGFKLELHNKKTFKIGNPYSNPSLTLKLNNKFIEYKLLLFPDYYFGKGFTDGELSIKNGTLSEFLNIALKNIGRNEINKFSASIKKIRGAWRYISNFSTRKSSKASVEHHYDISSAEFYKIFIDKKHYQYSCGYWPENVKSLEESQEAMINHIIKKLRIKENDTVLDIGSGFGGLSCAIAEKTGAKVDGITLSKVQLNFSKDLARIKKIDNLCQFKIEDYRDIKKKYSKVISKGMLEHVTRKYYKTYFKKIYDILKPDGKALIHTIGSIDKPRDPQSWITTFIFPSGYSPSLSQLMPSIENSKLVLSDLEILPGIHYASTLKEWKNRFIKHKDEVTKNFNERFFRLWLFYLASCEYAFRWTDICNFQILLDKDINIGNKTRDYMYS
mgnify:FL=1